MDRISRGNGTAGAALDRFSLACHGIAITHLDALCHVWNRDGMWNGRRPDDVIADAGVTFGGVQNWSSGIVTTGVLLDVAAHRTAGYVTEDAPVTGAELHRIAEEDGLSIEPGSALIIHSGRDAFEAATGTRWSVGDSRPGLHATCLEFFHEVDCAVVVWDMMDAQPNEYGVPHPVHAMMYNQGIALVDNALLGPFAQACAERSRRHCQLVIAPLPITGATGCAVNPLAVL